MLSPSGYQDMAPKDCLKLVLGKTRSLRKDTEATENTDKRKWRRAALGSVLPLFYGFAAGSSLTVDALSISVSPYQYLMLNMIENFSGASYTVTAIVNFAELTWWVICCGLGIAVVNTVGRRKAMELAFFGQAVCLLPTLILNTASIVGMRKPSLLRSSCSSVLDFKLLATV